MQTEQSNYQFSTLIDVLNWMGEYPKLWNQTFHCDGGDHLSKEELVETIIEMLGKKQYTSLLILLSINKYTSGLEDILNSVMYKMVAENIQEANVQEFYRRIVEDLKCLEEK